MAGNNGNESESEEKPKGLTQYGTGRVCADSNCTTILNTFHQSDKCYRHSGEKFLREQGNFYDNFNAQTQKSQSKAD